MIKKYNVTNIGKIYRDIRYYNDKSAIIKVDMWSYLSSVGGNITLEGMSPFDL